MSKASKIVGGAIIGIDHEVVVVNNKRYLITPPTIHRIAGAAYYLSDLGDGTNLREMITAINDSMKLAQALSFFIKGDVSLGEELSHGTLEEVVAGLEAAYSMISAQSFMKLSALAKSVANLTAKSRL